MANTPKMGWPYPSKGQEPWYESFEGFVKATDISAFVSREDRHLVLHGGGNVSFADPTLTWDSSIFIYSPLAGFYLEIEAGSAALASSGQVLYVNLVRNPTANKVVTVSVANQAPNTDEAYVVAIRSGNTVIFRNGFAVANGDTQIMGTGSPVLPITTKGDLIVGNSGGAGAAFPVGADGTALMADSTQPSGVKWGTVSSDHGSLSGLEDDDHPQYQLSIEKGMPSGYASLDASGFVEQAPALASETPGAFKIPTTGASGSLDAWVSGAAIAYSEDFTGAGWAALSGVAGTYELENAAFYWEQPSVFHVGDLDFWEQYDSPTVFTTADGRAVHVAPEEPNGSFLAVQLTAPSGAASMNLRFTAPEGQIVRIRYRVGSASSDNFIVQVDGVTVLTRSGFSARDVWQTLEEVLTTSGEHFVTFRFTTNADGTHEHGSFAAISKFEVVPTKAGPAFSRNASQSIQPLSIGAASRPSTEFYFSDDFVGEALSPTWRAVNFGGGGTVTARNKSHGWVTLTTAGAVGDGIALDLGTLSRALDRLGEGSIKWRIQVDTSTDVLIAVGLANEAHDDLIDSIALVYDTSADGYWLPVVGNGFPGTPYPAHADNQRLPNPEPHTIEIRIENGNDAYFFYDGQCIGRVNDGLWPDYDLSPFVLVKSLGAAAKTIHVDYVEIRGTRLEEA